MVMLVMKRFVILWDWEDFFNIMNKLRVLFNKVMRKIIVYVDVKLIFIFVGRNWGVVILGLCGMFVFVKSKWKWLNFFKLLVL